MKTLAAFILAFVCSTIPNAALAQQPAGAGQQAELIRLVNEQLKRIETLEAQLATLQQEVRTLAGLRGPGASQPGVVAAVEDEEAPQFEHAVAGAAPIDRDPESPAGDLPSAGPIDAYGSLRVLTAWDTGGRNEIRNHGSRLGLRGEKQLFDGVTAFARLELGVNMVANDRAILATADPGAPIGQGSQAVASRLGLVGVQTDVGQFSWGKQWSAYYDVAEFTDQFQIFSGAATGAFGAGTDGGLSGTGRAERALLYRELLGPVSAAVQVQNRASSPNDKSWADAWGGSTVINLGHGLGVGAAYNEVRDGVADPTPNEPKLGDKAAIFAVRYRGGPWYIATSCSILTQHEIDDLGRRYDGRGFEVAFRRTLTDRVWVEAGYNELRPNANHPGDFRVRLGIGNVVYRFGDASRTFVGFKIDTSRRSDGTSSSDHVVAAGLNYTF